MKSLHRIRSHYEHRIQSQRESFDVLDWASAQSQRKRFEVFIEHVDLEGKSLLDVGCGLGDLCIELRRRGISASYTGLDLLEKMVNEARRRCPEGDFRVGNLFDPEASYQGMWDVSFASGVFNLNLGNNEQFVPFAVGRMMRHSRRKVVFNMLHQRRTFEPQRYYYSHPDKIRRALAAMGWDLEIIEGYLPNDFTVICTRGEDDPATQAELLAKRSE
jgi:predicted TPR repeat methyltransferase